MKGKETQNSYNAPKKVKKRRTSPDTGPAIELQAEFKPKTAKKKGKLYDENELYKFVRKIDLEKNFKLGASIVLDVDIDSAWDLFFSSDAILPWDSAKGTLELGVRKATPWGPPS